MTYTGSNYSEIEAELIRLGATAPEAEALTDILHEEGWGGKENDELTDDVLESRIDWLRECRRVPYLFDRAMCGPDFDGDLDAVAEYLTAHGYPSKAVRDSYNGAPSEESQKGNGAAMPSDELFFEAVFAASNHD